MTEKIILTKRAKIRLFLKSILPTLLFDSVKNIYITLFSHFFDKKDSVILENYTKLFLEKYGRNVIDGPFSGMKYIDQSIGSSYVHKLGGFYEAVLHQYIQEVSKLPIKNILDIGAAEGYYTTGFAKIFKDANVVAFEMERKGRSLIQEMHTLNNLSNTITIVGEANSQNIVEHLSENTLLICDCEGAEKEILNIQDKSKFKNILFGIIELHDDIIPGCLDACIQYFKQTHEVEITEFVHANKNDFKFLKEITDTSDLSVLLRERGIQDQKWLIIRRK